MIAVLLALNTSSRQFSVALLKEEGDLVGELSLAPQGKNYTGLMPAVDYLLEHAGVRPRNLKAVAAAIGPGSFTGLRVGLAAAKGFCQGLDIPLIGISSLEALALQAPCCALPVCAILESRRGEVFSALFRRLEDEKVERVTEDMSIKIERLSSIVRERTFFLGNDFGRQGSLISKALGEDALLAPSSLWNPRASSVGCLALKRFHKADFDGLPDLVPTYMRPPDIRPNPYPVISQGETSIAPGD
ncbi:MAG: tRNA (adenosine(37)-N6)-threonylcarbamoyltransferase complex dimerization subunit type 1 TsaB [Deltaproteobacteria bacterium]|nr:tRNA (adenosine(37)-N6)-threonylcarbamoyltransferase complex dimerization subunit type 1 TsaB [Deltaproteobacteria bacterium]MBW2302839.1 tRNA (adenosine(37)-N6)-threonylcarbamoyltransferase complex dimerization subunit type 1 TsaB [Deltaproteobacteria bacterium]